MNTPKIYGALNLTDNVIVIDDMKFESGKIVDNILLTEEGAEKFYKSGLLLLSLDSGLNFLGPVGPSAWSAPSIWQPDVIYTENPPASCVVYLGQTYVCVTTHTSTSVFDVDKFVLVAAKGLQGDKGDSGYQGIPGIQGPAPWDSVQEWLIGISYNNSAPASVVTYNGSTYICSISHISSTNFDSSKFKLLASKGEKGDVGNTGPSPWKNLTPWAKVTPYTVAPASVVTYKGSSYICTTNHISSDNFDLSKWAILASRGNTILSGTDLPSNNLGLDGDFYIRDRTSTNSGRIMYGPKTNGSWQNGWIIEVNSYGDIPNLVDQLNLKSNKEDVYKRIDTYSKEEFNSIIESNILLSIALS